MNNYINQIAKVNKNDRFNAITHILEESNIDYIIQELPYHNSLGNIIVSFNQNDQAKIVVSAHYDNVAYTPGANDNASACSILLNLILNFNNKNVYTEFVFFDLEEKGFKGSDYYLQNNKDAILYAINLDMCGMGENILFATNLNDSKYESYEEIVLNHKAIKVDSLPPGDAYSFFDNNIKTFYIVNSTTKDIEWYKRYANGYSVNFMPDFYKTMHQPTDTIDTINLDEVNKIYLFVFDILSMMCLEIGMYKF